ncbi:N-acetyltransferase [Paenibacillus sp. UNC499MF]|uniref:GNAT family N-acetyltransferase n=1 Tax=Paenibacillus sp. UNC499MF TaxID=1502751 RepID=UPI00089F8558|nr:GNAT family N-acetyltransferase [Paenibacillus sp. UNC499MF]SEG78220.1 Acetyltransferase (GNAT) family protein [Paenibacillus sp. UNC499MF]
MMRPIPLDDVQAVLELLALQSSAYLVEAELIGYKDIPPLKDSPLTLRCSKETFTGYYLNDPEEREELAGAIAWEENGTELTITRMMVHPRHFRQGVASALIRHALAANPQAGRFVVSTGEANLPAVSLYEKFGFHRTGKRTIAPSVALVTFEKRRSIQ